MLLNPGSRLPKSGRIVQAVTGESDINSAYPAKGPQRDFKTFGASFEIVGFAKHKYAVSHLNTIGRIGEIGENWGDGENLGQLCKPSTTSLLCMTFESSPNPPNVKKRLCKHRKNALLLLKNES